MNENQQNPNPQVQTTTPRGLEMLNLLIREAKKKGASDLHIEPGLPATIRISTGLVRESRPITADESQAIAKDLLGDGNWPAFVRQGSADMARTIEAVRCRINILRTSRGIGFAIRLFSGVIPTLETLNLLPDLKEFCALSSGLVLISGPTGSGKSSTLAALIHEINQSHARHIITIEYPIEFEFEPHHAFIRQREVERDVPSMQQALVDAMREDPDVLMVGEMREPETMRLTLNASETGHLVFSTIHSATCVEALERMISAFPSEIQNSVAAQLADTLAAVICQRLRFHEDLGIRIPECEILRPTGAIKNFIRRGEYQQVGSALTTGAEVGMWTFDRYREWLSRRTAWYGAVKSPSSPSIQ